MLINIIISLLVLLIITFIIRSKNISFNDLTKKNISFLILGYLLSVFINGLLKLIEFYPNISEPLMIQIGILFITISLLIFNIFKKNKV